MRFSLCSIVPHCLLNSFIVLTSYHSRYLITSSATDVAFSNLVSPVFFNALISPLTVPFRKLLNNIGDPCLPIFLWEEKIFFLLLRILLRMDRLIYDSLDYAKKNELNIDLQGMA